MSRFIGLLATVVLVAALVGAAIGWQFPFLGGNRAANQLGSSPETTGAGTRTRVQPANQTNGQAQNTQRTAQAPSNVPIDPERPNTGTGTADTGPLTQISQLMPSGRVRGNCLLLVSSFEKMTDSDADVS